MRVAMNKIKIYLKQILCNVFRALWSESSHGKQQKPSERSFSNEVRRDFQTNEGNIYGLPKAESEYPLSHKNLKFIRIRKNTTNKERILVRHITKIFD